MRDELQVEEVRRRRGVGREAGRDGSNFSQDGRGKGQWTRRLSLRGDDR